MNFPNKMWSSFYCTCNRSSTSTLRHQLLQIYI